MITVRHLTRRFAGLVAVDDLSFDVARGEVVGFLGLNGAGKTTTLRILAGYLPASSGAASVAGFDVLRQSMQVRERIGYLPEAVPLYREHRVREMLEFQGRLHRIPRAELRRRIPAVLERVGVLDRAEQIVGTLSRGLRQRVGLAVALLPDPEVLILDEPTSGLDPLQRIEVRELVRELAREHTVILSSHILPEVEAVCGRLLIVHKGRLVANGAPAELVSELGGGSHVRLEAVVGPDVEEARRLLASLPGVSEVRDRGRLGIHHCFDLACREDVREDAGALAAQRGWALRELSFRRPALEDLFARIALELDDAPRRPAAPAQEGTPAAALGELPLAPAAAPGQGPPPGGAMRVLSPFERPSSESP